NLYLTLSFVYTIQAHQRAQRAHADNRNASRMRWPGREQPAITILAWVLRRRQLVKMSSAIGCSNDNAPPNRAGWTSGLMSLTRSSSDTRRFTRSKHFEYRGHAQVNTRIP